MLRTLWEHWDKGLITRRSALYWSLWFTTAVTFDVLDIVRDIVKLKDPNSILHVSAIVAAVLTPLFGLQGAMVKFYAQYKPGAENVRKIDRRSDGVGSDRRSIPDGQRADQ